MDSLISGFLASMGLAGFLVSGSAGLTGMTGFLNTGSSCSVSVAAAVVVVFFGLLVGAFRLFPVSKSKLVTGGKLLITFP